jgi:hypothetical protein
MSSLFSAPDVPLPGASSAVRLTFGALARLRGDRALHPDGIVLGGAFRSVSFDTGAALFEQDEERPVLVRLSRGAGVPQPMPDVLGCAVRVPDAYGDDVPQDFALASSAEGPLTRHILLPARDFLRAFYSSILPYRVGGETALIGARVDGANGVSGDRLEALRSATARGTALEVRMFAATRLGRWREVATVTLHRVVDDADARELRFNPWNCGGGIEPIGALNALRDPAYRASQRSSP